MNSGLLLKALLLLALLPLVCHCSSPDTEVSHVLETTSRVRQHRTTTTTLVQTSQLLSTFNATLFQLFKMCAADDYCTQRFFISTETALAITSAVSAAEVQADIPTAYQGFQLLLTRALSIDGGPFSEMAEEEAGDVLRLSSANSGWWLRLMRTMHPCSENEIWVQDYGCVCPHDKTCHEIDAAAHSWELGLFSPTVITATFICVAVFVWMIIKLQSWKMRLAHQISKLEVALKAGPAALSDQTTTKVLLSSRDGHGFVAARVEGLLE